jgi:murein DD-endopeptidase MepM/ murein hydrolase activator NlpD
MYAHLLFEPTIPEGARVRMGQRIGRVGKSGNASACHLHFELWSGPGWFEGGHPLPSVGRLLRTWDPSS